MLNCYDTHRFSIYALLPLGYHILMVRWVVEYLGCYELDKMFLDIPGVTESVSLQGVRIVIYQGLPLSVERQRPSYHN